MTASANATNWNDISATPSNFMLLGGRYGFAVVASWNSVGTVYLNMIGPDGSTLIPVVEATANGYAVIDVPPGTYQLTITTATGVSAAVARCP